MSGVGQKRASPAGERRAGERRVGRPASTDSPATRSAILQAARDLFAEKGYAATSTRDVAAAAGLTHGSVYHHFRTKRALFAEVVNATYDEFLASFAAATASGTLLGRAGALAEVVVAAHRSDPALVRFLSSVPLEIARHPELRGSIGDSALAMRALVEGLAARSADAGELPPGTSPGTVAATVLACTLGIALYADVLGEADFAEMLVTFGRLAEAAFS